jgi:DNA-directed RNA polymerase
MGECDLVKTEVVTLGRKEKKSVIMPTDEILKCLRGINLYNLPFRIPMIVKPKLYKREMVNGVIKERLGGYLLNDVKNSDNLIMNNWELKESTIIKDDNLVYDLVNNMNSVGYKINKDVLNFINLYGIEYDLIMYKEHPIKSKSLTKLNKRDRIELESDLNKKELQENILGLANLFSQLHEFYLPTRIDFRGRIYCISEFLNYQSNELAKSLLLFSKGEQIKKSDVKAIEYLKAYGANCFGNKLDKKS